MDFIAIDFETATSDRNSPCEIGLTFVKNDKISKTESWLVKPKCYPNFDPFNILIHGIQPEDVSKKPEFNSVWKSELRDVLDNQLVIAHFASFDMSVLRRTLELYKAPFPKLNYLCSYTLSKKIWPKMLSYDLASLCKSNKISFNHHRAGPDSLACAKLSLKAFKVAGIKNPDDVENNLDIKIGRLFEGGYNPCSVKSARPNMIKGDKSKNNPESIFYGKNVVFTGKLSSMPRNNAWKIVADIGGNNSETITNETNFLVVGHQDTKKIGKDGMSNKQERVQKLLDRGASIEILSESDFLRNI